FLDGPDRRARDTVEHITESLLGDLGHRLNALPINRDIDKIRCGWEVVIPHAVMHHLEVPDSCAGLRLECHQTLSIEVVPRALSPIIIIARRTEGQIDVAQLFVAAHHRPDIRIANILPGVVLPRFDAWLLALRHSMERPPRLAGAHIKASDVTRRHGFYLG